MPVIMITVVIAMVGLMVISGGSLNPMMLIFPADDGNVAFDDDVANTW
ncbi:cell-division protein FtsK [Corynebacterium diphtheriae bv. intermedius str. NCTC 5011]|nr:cell-division protein FtsK [Corynebacterium diphtheriae bv. intermedius str. NCTC 5011]